MDFLTDNLGYILAAGCLMGFLGDFKDALKNPFSTVKNTVRDTKKVFGGVIDVYKGIGQGFAGAGRGVRDFFNPEMPDIPTPPTAGAPIRSTKPATTAADEQSQVFGRRAIRTRGPSTALGLGSNRPTALTNNGSRRRRRAGRNGPGN